MNRIAVDLHIVALTTLEILFLGREGGNCRDACDSNDDGEFDISDAINSLYVLFLGQGEIPAPGMIQCGPDPTIDELICESSQETCLD